MFTVKGQGVKFWYKIVTSRHPLYTVHCIFTAALVTSNSITCLKFAEFRHLLSVLIANSKLNPGGWGNEMMGSCDIFTGTHLLPKLPSC